MHVQTWQCRISAHIRRSAGVSYRTSIRMVFCLQLYQKVPLPPNPWEPETVSQGPPASDTKEGTDVWGERQQTWGTVMCPSPEVRCKHQLIQQSKWGAVPVPKPVSLTHVFCTLSSCSLPTLCSEAEWQSKWICLYTWRLRNNAMGLISPG